MADKRITVNGQVYIIRKPKPDPIAVVMESKIKRDQERMRDKLANLIQAYGDRRIR